MAKIKTTCACGGTYDGTPSGASRHERTSRHIAWLFPAEPTEDRPTDLPLEGEYTVSDEESEASRRVHGINAALVDARKAQAKAEHDLAYRTSEKHAHQYGEKAIENTRGQLSGATERVLSLESELPGAEAALEALRSARTHATFEKNEKLGAYLAARFATEGLRVRHRGYGNVDVTLLTGETGTRDDGATYAKTAFGFEASVRGPRRAYGSTFEVQTVTPAYPSWGSYSGMDTVAKARTMMRIYELAIEIAEHVNELYGIES